jgi:hypothetical protein
MKQNSVLFLINVAAVAAGTLIAMYVAYTIIQKQLATSGTGSTGKLLSVLGALQP